MLPYILRKWEPLEQSVVNVDLSSRSLMRGRFRTALSRGKSEFYESDIIEFLNLCQKKHRKFAHVETFGMLHHMTDPTTALQGIYQQLLPGGTLRAMVYNTPGRDWVHALQDYFKVLFDPTRHASTTVNPTLGNVMTQVFLARTILTDFARQSPFLAERLRAIGKTTMENPARFADTFLHPHELRWSIEKWLEGFAQSGLVLAGIFDRYAELDDLPNPLYSSTDLSAPKTALRQRAADKRFEGNLETIWFKQPSNKSMAFTSAKPRTTAHLPHLKFRTPPRSWFDFDETKHLKLSSRMRIWHAFLDGSPVPPSAWGGNDRTLQRLSRLGAILIDQIDPAHAKIALAPMCDMMTPPDLPMHRNLEPPTVLNEYLPGAAQSVQLTGALHALNDDLETARHKCT